MLQCLFLCFMYCALFSMVFFPPSRCFCIYTIFYFLLCFCIDQSHYVMCVCVLVQSLVVVLLSILAIPFSQMALLTSFSLLISSTMTMLETSTIWYFGHIGCWCFFSTFSFCICYIWNTEYGAGDKY